ncbi:MAG: XRE family transcriptional regulator [Alphaproteobacteria bacterium BRH_c36]|nr:MAG: XRE family transcriptional regulator [Alphaproteobacteria bacterium BRH_c36]
MIFPSPLRRGRLLKRYKRFLADIELDNGGTITASCPNTGSMMGLSDPGINVWVSASDSPTRKYPYTLELVENNIGNATTLVGINTGHPNRIVAEAIGKNRIPALKGYASLKREQKYGKASRIDILLEDDNRGRVYVEIKNVHLMRKAGLAEFPDSVTERGLKHLDELGDMAEQGHRAVMLFLIQRGDATRMSPCADIDPAYAKALARAMSRGVETLAYRCEITPERIQLAKSVPIRMP